MQSFSLKHHFLIAMPNLRDPLFARSVTYICEHTPEDGAIGFKINEASDLNVAELLEQVGISHEQPALQSQTVLVGGPLHPDRGFVLHSPIGQWQSCLTLSEELAVAASQDILHALARGQGPRKTLITLGYAGWEKGQLEQEISDNAWLYVPADLGLLFDTPLESRWRLAAAKLNIDITQVSSQVGHA